MKNITFYGATWCSDCRRAKSFLEKNNITFEHIDMEKVDGAVQKIIALNKGKRVIPTIVIDNIPHPNPSNQDLKSILGI